MIGRQVEERVEFDKDTRREVLQKTGFRCASCGEKLDMVRHTIDHIIPISRGGTNDIENLIGLCKICNKYKTDIVYYPGDYYTYLMMTNTRAIDRIHRHVVKYLRDEIHKLDISRYPLISPCSTAICFVNGIRPKGYVRQLLFDIIYMGSDMRKANASKVKFLKGYTYYAIIKRTTQNMLAILRVDYNVGKHPEEYNGVSAAQLTIFDEWVSVNPKVIAPLMRNIAEVVASRYWDLGIQLDEICIASTNDKIPDTIYDHCLLHSFGWRNNPVYITIANGCLNDREELGRIKYFAVCIDKDMMGGSDDANEE